MTQRKFVLTKQTRKNGNYYYTCKVMIERHRKPKNVLELIKYVIKQGEPYYKEYYIDKNGYGYLYPYEYFFDEREHALDAINKYIERKEEEDGEKVISTETEIIYK